jgi:hypothetical protein
MGPAIVMREGLQAVRHKMLLTIFCVFNAGAKRELWSTMTTVKRFLN